MRASEQIFKGKVNSLKRFKDDAKEVTNGMECGIGLGGFNDLKEGDLIEAFSTEKLAADLGALATDVAKAKAKAKAAVEKEEAEAAAAAEAEAAVEAKAKE